MVHTPSLEASQAQRQCGLIYKTDEAQDFVFDVSRTGLSDVTENS